MTDKQEGNKPPKFTSNRGQAKRSADYNERIREKGIIQITVRASEEARPLFNAAAKLIRDGSEPGDAFRIVAGSKATDGSAPLPGHEQQREQGGDLADQQRQQQNAFMETLLATQRQQHAELLRAVTQAQGQGDTAGSPEVLAALRRMEALTQERESQRRPEPDHTQALADLAASINRDRDQQQQRHGELLQAVTQAQGDAAGLPEVLAALRRVEEARADWNSYDDEQLEGINALTDALASLDTLDDLAAGLEDLRAYDAEQLEGIKALAEALTSLDALDDLAARLDDLRADSAQQLDAVKELAASLAPLESVVDGLVAAQDADKELIDKLKDLLTPMVRLSFAIQAGEKDPVTGWRALVDKVRKLPG